MTEKLLKATHIQQAANPSTHWHGYRVMRGEGSYLPMQATQSISKDYEVKHKGESSQGYPQGLVETIIERGTGQIHRFKLSNRHINSRERHNNYVFLGQY